MHWVLVQIVVRKYHKVQNQDFEIIFSHFRLLLHFFLILAHCEEQEQPLASNHAINRRTDIMIANIFSSDVSKT